MVEPTASPGITMHEIFSSIQGEGSLTGVPMTFIRLWGCNMQPPCSWCDTPQLSKSRHPTTVEAVAATSYALGNRWTCITGGEPTIHRNFDLLVDTLQAAGLKVAVETNGTRPWTSIPDWVCVSPKAKGSLEPATLVCADEIKLLVGAGQDHYDPEEFISDHPGLQRRICLQPVWPPLGGGLFDNLQRTIELCHEYQVRLSIQTHKLIGVR